ncbi:MAG: putative sulfate exporter family transporter [Spirochaetales bacterium]|nr:putative sulfate exporter family transporter [Spirochaetales bacterium]
MVIEEPDLSLLISIGNAICGSSVIAAAQSIVKADDEKVGLSIAVINFLGTLGILLPALVIGIPFLNDVNSGVLIGNTLQAIGQVSAAGFSIGEETGQIATLEKMGRILRIMPVALGLSLFRKKDGGIKRNGTGVPWFDLDFDINMR